MLAVRWGAQRLAREGCGTASPGGARGIFVGSKQVSRMCKFQIFSALVLPGARKPSGRGTPVAQGAQCGVHAAPQACAGCPKAPPGKISPWNPFRFGSSSPTPASNKSPHGC